MTVFFAVSGGPIGLEPLVKESGPGMAILLILAMPILYAIPSALMTAELTSAMPAEGGYYVWVREALGEFWGFVCAFWTWLYTWVDAAIYTVAASTIVAESLKTLAGIAIFADNPTYRWLLAVAFIVLFALLNIFGIKTVGISSVWLSALLLLPFAMMVVVGIGRVLSDPHLTVTPFTSEGQSYGKAFGAGLWVAMWNYLGWDSMSTVAGEVEEPQKRFPKALFTALPLIVACYLLPTLVGVAYYRDWSKWDEGAWIPIARAVGGEWLAHAVSISQLLSALGLFTIMLMVSSRLPFVLAGEGYLPKFLTWQHRRYGTPVVAIAVCSVIFAIFSLQSFSSLVVTDVILYTSALLLEFAALIVLRIKRPEMPRPYKIPGGLIGTILIMLMPTGVLIFAMFSWASELFAEENGRPWVSVGWTGLALALAPAMYFLGPIIAHRFDGDSAGEANQS